MLDNIDALLALYEHGTMGKAAVVLRVSQSAISKRIENLEYSLKQQLIERQGRRVRLTPVAVRFIERARPLIAEIKSTALDQNSSSSGKIVIDLSVSVLLSWGAEALGVIAKKNKLDFEIHTSHASVAVERVRSGETSLALVQGKGEVAPDLIAQPVIEEKLVIVPSGLKPFKLPKSGTLSLLCIESHTQAWRWTKRGLDALRQRKGCGFNLKIQVQQEVEGFSAICELARAGFGHGLVPLGIARALGIKDSALVYFPDPGVCIPISLFGRKSTLARKEIEDFYNALKKVSEKLCGADKKLGVIK